MSSHPDFTSEQSVLRKAWFELNKKYKEFEGKIATKQTKKASAVDYAKEGYGQVPILTRNIRELEEQQSRISESLDKIYFGKIQYEEDGMLKTVYIGDNPHQLTDANIVSYWSPVGQMYHSTRGNYKTPNEGLQHVDLHLIQTLIVKQDNLQQISNKLVNNRRPKKDEVLIQQLKRKGPERLRDIVITIQEEQIEIIRAPFDNHIVIQGGAGTGKTIVLVYRVAYLLFAHSWQAEEVLFISPSEAFEGYLSLILPGAKLESVVTRTLNSFYPSIGTRILSSLSALPEIMAINRAERSIAADVVRFKGSLAFKKLIDAKLSQVMSSFLKDIEPFNYKLYGELKSIPAEDIRKWFRENSERLSFDGCKKLIRDRIKTQLESLEDASQVSNRRLRLYSPQETESLLGAYFKKWPNFQATFTQEIIPWYFNKLRDCGHIAEALEDAISAESQTVSVWTKVFSLLSHNDWGALYYISQKMLAQPDKLYKLIVIDEAQALSPLWLEGLRYSLAKDGKFLLAGDINQKAVAATQDDWSDYAKIIGGIQVMRLTKCYRMTDNIAQYATRIIRKHSSRYPLHPAGRDGAKVDVLDVLNVSKEKHISRIVYEVTEALKNSQTVALIGRTQTECEELYSHIKNVFGESSLVKERESLKGNVFVVPVALAIGLEFDTVLVINHRDYDIDDPIEAQHLYLAATRAVHKLIMI